MKNVCKLFVLAFTLVLLSFGAHADLTPANRAVFLAAINAETNPGLVTCRQARDDGCIAAYYNVATSTKAWREAVPGKEVFEAMNLTAYDGLSAGKRDAWALILGFSPLDFSRNKIRAAVNDVWGATDRDAILNAVTEFASRFEMLFGGNSATTGGVTAIKRSLPYVLNINDVSATLNP
jgi:hypothetical protein